MDVVLLAPFGLEPKGTVRARMVPIAQELQRRGHAVDIVVPPWDDQERSGKTIEFEGVTVRNVETTGTSIRESLATTRRMVRLAQSLDPDVYHAFKPKGHSGLATLYLSKRSSTPIVLDTDDWEGRGGHNERMDHSRLRQTVFHYQERFAPRHADAVTVASRTLQTQVWGEGVEPDRVFYAPNGQRHDQIDVESGDPARVRESLDLGDARIVLLYTRFFEYDIERVVTAFSEVEAEMDDVVFVTVGAGKYGEEQEFEAVIRDAGLDDVTHMCGWVDFADLPHYFAAADVAVFPFDDSLITRSKCPAKLTELMLSELPVVADAVGQTREYVTHNESGLLSRPEDPSQFADHVVDLLDDPDRRAELGRNARQRILSEFNWASIVDEVEAAYECAISDGA